jgi:hypothetical protein
LSAHFQRLTVRYVNDSQAPGITRHLSGFVPVMPPDPLKPLSEQFPEFRIWREITGPERIRYVAVRRRPGTSPHTLVTSDLDELSTVLHDARTRAARCGGRPR